MSSTGTLTYSKENAEVREALLIILYSKYFVCKHIAIIFFYNILKIVLTNVYIPHMVYFLPELHRTNQHCIAKICI